MTLAAARQFIQRAVTDRAFVQQVNAAPNSEAVQEILSQQSLAFNYEEFVRAYFNLLTCCQTIEQAKAAKEVKLWWDCLKYTLNRSEADIQ